MVLSLPKWITEHYKENGKQISEIFEANECFMFTAKIMQTRLAHGKEFPDLWHHFFDTPDLVIYPQGNNDNVYFLLTTNKQGRINENGERLLKLIRPENLASNGGAIVEILDHLKGNNLIKVSRKKITTEKYLTRDQTLKEQVWRILARHPDEVHAEITENEDLLHVYTTMVQLKTHDSENMTIYLDNPLKQNTTFKTLCIGGISGRSSATGWYNLNDYNGRFIGITPNKNPESSRLEKSVLNY